MVCIISTKIYSSSETIRRCFHELTVVEKNCIHFALRFSSLPSLREDKDELVALFSNKSAYFTNHIEKYPKISNWYFPLSTR